MNREAPAGVSVGAGGLLVVAVSGGPGNTTDWPARYPVAAADGVPQDEMSQRRARPDTRFRWHKWLTPPHAPYARICHLAWSSGARSLGRSTGTSRGTPPASVDGNLGVVESAVDGVVGATWRVLTGLLWYGPLLWFMFLAYLPTVALALLLWHAVRS